MGSSDSTETPLFNTLFQGAGEIFEKQKLTIPFQEYLQLLQNDPAPHLKSAHEIVRDILWKDTYETQGIGKKKLKRSRIFDYGQNPIIGHDEAIHQLLHQLNRNTSQGTRLGKAILLVGPNRTGKSILVDHIIDALRTYYADPDHGFYGRIAFSFLSGEKVIGFGSNEIGGDTAEKSVASRIKCTAGCHPLWLFPREQRVLLLDELLEHEGWDYSKENLPPIYSHIIEGHLCATCETIIRALIWKTKREHKGIDADKLMQRVYEHVDLERINFNNLSENGVVTTSITAGYNIKAYPLQGQVVLPPFLAGEPLMLHSGDFVGAQGGLLVRDEFFKRDLGRIEADLMSIDSGYASTGTETVQVNICMIGTDNFATFMGVIQQMGPNAALILSRASIINVMNLLKASDEKRLHEDSIARVEKNGFHFMPHVLDILMRLVVMTRIREVKTDHFSRLDERVKNLLNEENRGLDAYDKTIFYDKGKFDSPEYDKEELQLLNRIGDDILDEYTDRESEGQFGMNFPEVEDLFTQVMDIASEDEIMERSITYDHVVQAFRKMLDEGTRYTFVQDFEAAQQQGLESQFRYNYFEFPKIIESKALYLLEEDFFESCPILPEKNILTGFREYLENVNAFLKGNKEYRKNGADYPVRVDLMEDFENIWGLVDADDEKRREFRSSKIMTPLANWRLEADNKNKELDDDELNNIFPYLLDQLEQNYRTLYKSKFQRIRQAINAYFEFGDQAPLLTHDASLREDTSHTIQQLQTRGYLEHEIKYLLGKLQSAI